MEIEICRGEKVRGMGIGKRLYEAAVEGDVRVLQELLQQDALVLDRLTLNNIKETPLHIAAMRGHIEFVKLLLSRSPQLAAELDSRKLSPLHIASDKGYLEIVRELLVVNPEMCLIRDRDGRNPLHLAATKGRVEVIKELIQSRPSAALQTTNNGENVLHLCVKHYQLEALNVLMKIGTWDHEFLSAKDVDGETILNMAITDKQNEGWTHAHSKSSKKYSSHDDPQKTSPEKFQKDDWIEKERNTLMIVASLIATMAFHAGVNPAGGVWQDDSNDTTGANPPIGAGQEYALKEGHKAGESVMANGKSDYTQFVVANTVGFVASLSVLLLLISGLPIRRKGFMWILMFIMWIAITMTAYTYAISISQLMPARMYLEVPVASISTFVWMGIMAFLFLIHTIRLIVKAVRKLRN